MLPITIGIKCLARELQFSFSSQAPSPCERAMGQCSAQPIA
jgi:hypothetical protein